MHRQYPHEARRLVELIVEEAAARGELTKLAQHLVEGRVHAHHGGLHEQLHLRAGVPQHAPLLEVPHQQAEGLRDEVLVLVEGQVHADLDEVGQRAAVERQDRKGLLEGLLARPQQPPRVPLVSERLLTRRARAEGEAWRRALVEQSRVAAAAAAAAAVAGVDEA